MLTFFQFKLFKKSKKKNLTFVFSLKNILKWIKIEINKKRIIKGNEIQNFGSLN